MQPQLGGKSHLKLNNAKRPIAKKYSDGKVKRTLKRGLKGLEIVKRERHGNSIQIVQFVWTLKKKKECPYYFVFIWVNAILMPEFTVI